MNKLYNRIRGFHRDRSGFTIIEVVLVLAIAGLIFLMVFIALPALQSNQRDTSRKNEVGTISSYIGTFSSNNRGQLPPEGTYETGANAAESGFGSYLKNVSDSVESVSVRDGGDAQDDQDITVSGGNSSSGFSVIDGEIVIFTGAKPGTSTSQISGGTSRQFVVCTYLEANNGSVYCQ